MPVLAPALPVTFFLPGEGDLGDLRRLDPERCWRDFVRGERAWILQTWLRLTAQGFAAELSDTLPPSGLVVFHAKHRREVMGQRRRLRDALLVAVRADNHPPAIADFEILQNGHFMDGRRRFALPHWPQAGLEPRDPHRGSTILRAGYKGFARNLHPMLRSSDWLSFLARRGIEWVSDEVEFAGRSTHAEDLAWNDYTSLDLVVALRPPSRRLHTEKPATKLFNAWHAGVPAVLGPEVALRELSESPLDYLEATTLPEVMAAVDRLREDPALYTRMVAHGRERSRCFTFEAVTRRWTELLGETLPTAVARGEGARWRHLPLPLRAFLRRVARILPHKTPTRQPASGTPCRRERP